MKTRKWYVLFLTEEGDFITTLRIPTFDRIALENKKRIAVSGGADSDKWRYGYLLNLSKEEALTFKTVYKNYIVEFAKQENWTTD